MGAGRRRVVVIGGGLAGLTAALDCADAGAAVTLVERRRRLGGLTWSFERGDRTIDNGQHVFLRCCTAYLGFLDRIGSAGDVALQSRLDISVLRPAGTRQPVEARLRRARLPAPLHLAGSLLRYRHLSRRDRLRIGLAALPLRDLDLSDPALDEETFGSWLESRHQTSAAVEALWDLITVPTVNLPAREASLAMAAKVFQTGLLSDPGAGDLGWALVPLGRLHGERAGAALAKAGVEVRLGERARRIDTIPGRGTFTVRFDRWSLEADGAVVAVPHDEAAELLPAGAVNGQSRLHELGDSAIVDVHLLYERMVMQRPMVAAIGTTVQWVFDRSAASGLPADGRQYLAVSISSAGEQLARRPEELIAVVTKELAELLPLSRSARVVDALVTKERSATFRAVPGSGRLRPRAPTNFPGLAIAGAWTDTGWPATMEGAVRSGHDAAGHALAGFSRPALAGFQSVRTTTEVA
jgi:squalene-associated FAD-dependent desaturase